MRGALVGIACLLLAARAAAAPAEAWTTADYVKAGVPAADHAWSADELAHAVDVIARASGGHSERLPRHDGARSGPVFARLTAAPAPADTSQPIAPQFAALLGRQDALGKLFGLYAAERAVPSRDALEVAGAVLENEAAIMELIGPLATELGAAAREPARQQALRAMRSGAADLVLAALAMASRDAIPRDDRRALVGHLARALPSLYAHLDPDAQRVVRARLVVVEAQTSGPLHDDLVAVDGALPGP